MSTDCEEDDADSLFDINLKINDSEFDIPSVATPSLESILSDMESEDGSIDNASLNSFQSTDMKLHSVLSHCILQGITSQITSARERVGAGWATVIANRLKFIAVGTSHGFILNFDAEQNLCWCYHDSGTDDQGAISALAFNLDSTRLLAGYERSYIVMIDVTNGNVLRRLPDAHAPQSSVLHLRFTFKNNLALCGDSRGCVFSLTFHRRLGVRSWNSRCLFSGATGEVCVFEPLVHDYDTNFLSQNVLVAMATMSKVIVISVYPQVKCLYSRPLPRVSTSLPLLCWQLIPMTKMRQPVLTWGRGSEINFTRLIIHGTKNIKLVALKTIQLSYSFIAMEWLSMQHLALIDSRENLHLIDVRSEKELETVELENVELVYSSAHFKALAIGGGVSEAFSLAGEKACYNSLSSRGDQLFLLGTQAVHLIKLRSWSERLMYLSERGRWADALSLAAEEGNNREKIATLLLQRYLVNVDVVDKESLIAAVNCCVKLNQVDVLCNELWDAVSNDFFMKELYYSLLTDYIVNSKLSRLTPFITQSLVAHLESKRDVQILENVLLMLELDCLDLHQALNICRRHKLYNAWIHLTTKTIGDYASPLTEFLSELTPFNQRLGNTMLVYVSSCLAGLGYPNGNIPKECIKKVKFDVLRCLETLHSINYKENEKTYPYLRALLKFNIRECLNVIELAFTEVEFSGEMGLLQRNRLVKILMEIVTPPEFSECEEINLACFICRLVTSDRINLEDNLLGINFEKLMQSTSGPINLRDQMEREQSWLDLIISNRLKNISSDDMIKRALESKCFRVAEYLYNLDKNYCRIVECYLNDMIRKNEVFDYIVKYIDVNERCIRDQFSSHFSEIITIDHRKTVEIVVEYFPELIPQFCDTLEGDDNLRFQFLDGLINCDVKLPSNISEIYLDLLCVYQKEKVKEFVEQRLCTVKSALEITQKYDLHEATAILLEQDGEWFEALELYLDHGFVDRALNLCIRGTEHLDSDEAKKLWIFLLEHEKNNKSISLRQLLHSTAPYIHSSQLLDFIFNVNFCDIKTSLLEIYTDYLIDTYLNTINLKLLGEDIQQSLAKAIAKNRRGISFMNSCDLCHGTLSSRNGESTIIATWGCGHCFHRSCSVCPNLEELMCPLCKKKTSDSSHLHLNRKIEPSASVKANIRPDLEGHF
ncbi:hypothetical protein WA026_020057 [Henosepilachna vigintioctopunctata]|uniref:RING-type domain-containing protein n=1 Tax=Henosepilachna vigintioctopunctata TaxID=420089 RepID=A0AAW1UAU7_9CUCU